MTIATKLRQCKICKQTKAITEFYKVNDRFYRAECKKCTGEKFYAKNRVYRAHHKEKLSEWHRSYRKREQEKVKKHHRNYYHRHKHEPHFKLLTHMRSRLSQALRGNWKTGKTVELLGCSIGQLQNYLTSKFQFGMTWENYGEWHVDHIKPCSSFDFTKKADQQKCFHYTNLQPLWKLDNIKKGDKL